MKKLFCITILLFSILKVNAQYYDTGVEPFSVQWRQIKAGKIRITYPANSDTLAQQYLNLLLTTDTIVGKDYAVGKSRIDVVLHTNSGISNGFVAWAPRRMELITTPPFDGFAMPWNKQLALHEMRHVKQMYALNKGTVKLASFLFGQQIVGLSAGFIPLWYLEGDAVATETAFSNTGRGRSASFYNQYKANLLENPKPYTYDKWLLGSYKNFIPNHYSLGYQLVSYGNLKYGNNIWVNTLDFTSKYPFTVFPFYFGLKRETGLSRKKFAEKAFAYQDSVWTNELLFKTKALSKSASKNDNGYANYLYPYLKNDSTIISYKNDLKEIPAFISIDNLTKKEKKLISPGYLLGKPFINDSLIIWSEYRPHLRWEYKNYGSIVKYNYLTKTKKVLGVTGILRSPVYNHSNNSIYCIEYLPNGYSQIVRVGKENKKDVVIILPFGEEPFELIFDQATNKMYVAVVANKGKEVKLIQNDNTLKKVFGSTFLDVNSILVDGDSMYFSATYSGSENVYIHNLKDNSTKKFISSFYSSRYLSLASDGKMVFSDYTIDGYRIQISDGTLSEKTINIDTVYNDNFSKNLSSKACANIDSITIKSNAHTSSPYRGIKTLFNFHSWTPFYFNPYNSSPEESSIKLGATLLSQNLTGSTTIVLGYGYGTDHLFRANIRYQGFWPVFSFNFEIFDDFATLYPRTGAVYYPSVKRNKLRLYSYLPFTLSKNNKNIYLQIFNSFERTNDYLFDDKLLKYRSGLYTNHGGLYFSALRLMSHKDQLPKYGFEVTFSYLNAPYSRKNLGSLGAIKSTLYLPGIMSNHHIKLKTSLQNQWLKKYYLSNKVDPPRGYAQNKSEQYSGISADYLFPIAYPDRSIGALAYFKRISLDLFYEYARNSYPSRYNNTNITQVDNLQSVGFEVFVDLNFLRTRYPFRLKYLQAFTGKDYAPYSQFSITYDIYGGFGNRNQIEQ